MAFVGAPTPLTGRDLPVTVADLGRALAAAPVATAGRVAVDAARMGTLAPVVEEVLGGTPGFLTGAAVLATVGLTRFGGVVWFDVAAAFAARRAEVRVWPGAITSAGPARAGAGAGVAAPEDVVARGEARLCD